MRIVIPAYGRHELTRRVVMYYESFDLNVFVAESPDAEGRVSGVANALVNNAPLGKKFNDAIELCLGRYDEDIIICGSDCLLSMQYLGSMIARVPLYNEVRGCHFYNTRADQVIYLPGFACGSGKYMSREFLERCDGRPYADEDTVNVDWGPRAYLKSGERKESVTQSATLPTCMEIRTNSNMTSWEWIGSHSDVVTLTARQKYVAFGHLSEQPEYWALR